MNRKKANVKKDAGYDYASAQTIHLLFGIVKTASDLNILEEQMIFYSTVLLRLPQNYKPN